MQIVLEKRHFDDWKALFLCLSRRKKKSFLLRKISRKSELSRCLDRGQNTFPLRVDSNSSHLIFTVKDQRAQLKCLTFKHFPKLSQDLLFREEI